MSDTLIRTMRPSDIPIVASWIVQHSLWQRYQVTESKFQSNLHEALQRGDLLLVVDESREGNPAHEEACGLAWVDRDGAFGRSPYLRILGVKDGQAGKGLGAALLEHTEQCVAEFATEFFLLVSDFNQSAQRFYQHQGFSEVGALPGYVLPDVTELIYWKRLKSAQGELEGGDFPSNSA